MTTLQKIQLQYTRKLLFYTESKKCVSTSLDLIQVATTQVGNSSSTFLIRKTKRRYTNRT